MATIQIDLTEDDVLEACKIYATTRILNEGRPMSAELTERQVSGGNVMRIERGCKVWVETDRMARTALAKMGE